MSTNNENLENMLFWYVYDNLGVHVDDYGIDCSTRENLIKSLKEEGIDFTESDIPTKIIKDGTLNGFIKEVVQNSIFVEKNHIFHVVVMDEKFRNEAEKEWSIGTPAINAHAVQDDLHNAIERLSCP